MVITRGRDGTRRSCVRGRLAKVTSLALGVAMFGTVGLSGTLAQDDDASGGIADAETLVESIIADIFADLFGGGIVADDAVVSGGGDLNIGGSSGSTVSMGGGSSGGVTMGGGVTVGEDNGG